MVEAFAQVSNVSVEVAESHLSLVVETTPVSPTLFTTDNYLASVQYENEIMTAMKLMRNVCFPDSEDTSADLLKLQGEGCAMIGASGSDIMGGRESPR